MNESAPQLEQIASRAMTLYSRPTVAMELMRLAEQPHVDAQALKDCVAQDPALVCKILRVVNSSLFGLHRPVADLNQAIGLLGIKPLKLLVLGFNLPDALFAEAAARELQWYWTNTLTRAVAARMIAEQLWRQSGDEAFTAGLLQDIGILVLLRELGEPYAKFLTGVVQEKCHLAALEQDTLGFDHLQLSAALLDRWHLPERLVDAIGMPKRQSRLARLNSPEADLPQILHLAELLMQLVGQRRLGVLTDLLDAGKVYRGMTKSQLTMLVEGLQPQVDQLAQVLSLELSGERNYVRMLLDAHRQMAELSEQMTHDPSAAHQEDRAYNQLLSQAHELNGAMRNFLDGRPADDDRTPAERTSSDEAAGNTATLFQKLCSAATKCRNRREELSLLVIEPNVYDVHSEKGAEEASRQVRRALRNTCAGIDRSKVTLLSISEQRSAAIISNCERRSAITLAHSIIAEHEKLKPSECRPPVDLATTVSIGVATLSAVPKNFDPAPMIESAARCLSAARLCGISTVKSIEV